MLLQTSDNIVGNRTSLRKRDGSTLTYLYDNLNRVIRKTVPERAGLTAAQTRDVYYDYYHALGLQTKARFDGLDGEGVTFYYDEFGQPTTTLLAMNGSARYVSYYYDDAGNLWRLTHPDGANFYHLYDALGADDEPGRDFRARQRRFRPRRRGGVRLWIPTSTALERLMRDRSVGSETAGGGRTVAAEAAMPAESANRRCPSWPKGRAG